LAEREGDGVVDEDVEATESLHGLVDEPLRIAGDVGLDRDGVTDPRHDLACLALRFQIIHDDRGAITPEPLRDRRTDATRGPCAEGDLPGEPHRAPARYASRCAIACSRQVSAGLPVSFS